MPDALPPALTPERLTQALRRAGVLDSGWVADIAIERTRPTLLSQFHQLRVTYEGPHDDAPVSLMVKSGLAARREIWRNAGQREIAFYADIAPATPTGLVPRCFDAFWDGAAEDGHLVLENLAPSHLIATAWPLPPSDAQCDSVIRTLARFHAAWWDDMRLGVSLGEWTTPEKEAADIARLGERLGRFIDRLGDDLPPGRRDFFTRLLRAIPRLFERYATHRNLTLIHGDAHVWNFFMPRDGGADVRIFDWDSWRIDTATDDLAYMMAMHWYPARRARLERRLLDLYHATLIAHGVAGYSRDELARDYRLSVLGQSLRPVIQADLGIPPVIWWNNLERILMAVDDLDCATLLE